MNVEEVIETVAPRRPRRPRSSEPARGRGHALLHALPSDGGRLGLPSHVTPANAPRHSYSALLVERKPVQALLGCSASFTSLAECATAASARPGSARSFGRVTTDALAWANGLQKAGAAQCAPQRAQKSKARPQAAVSHQLTAGRLWARMPLLGVGIAALLGPTRRGGGPMGVRQPAFPATKPGHSEGGRSGPRAAWRRHRDRRPRSCRRMV